LGVWSVPFCASTGVRLTSGACNTDGLGAGCGVGAHDGGLIVVIESEPPLDCDLEPAHVLSQPKGGNAAMNFTVFYAWQSDVDHRINRSFIEKALKDALKRIDSDISIEASPRLDKDTVDVPGIPNIAEIIFEKIRQCGIFVADLTFIGATAESGELIPNPNVLLEVGIALATVGWQRIIQVTNTAFGQPQDLPFDLQHRRWPIRYACNDRQKTSKGEIRKKLSQDLEREIRLIIKSGVLTSTSQSERQRFTEERDRIHQEIKAGEFAELDAERGAVTLTIFPVSLQQLTDEIFQDENLVAKFKPIWTSGWDWEYIGNGFRTYSSREDRESVTEVRRDGTIIAANNRLQAAGGRAFESDTNVHVIPLWSIEGVLLDRITLYLNLLQKVRIEGPFFIDIALLSLAPTMVEMRPRDYSSGDSRVFTDRDIVPDLAFLDKADAEYDIASVASFLKPALDFMWRNFNFRGSPRYTKVGTWIE
jgi:hypothetical protein